MIAPPKYSSTGAVLAGPYRYHLHRVWDPSLPAICWVMLNPSTADGHQDDPTLRKCVGFSKRLGYGSLAVVNLFAWRATDPEEMFAAAKAGRDIVEPENQQHLVLTAEGAGRVICAWGGKGGFLGRGCTVVEQLREVAELLALRSNADGSPVHPLYVPYEQHPAPWGRTGNRDVLRGQEPELTSLAEQ